MTVRNIYQPVRRLYRHTANMVSIAASYFAGRQVVGNDITLSSISAKLALVMGCSTTSQTKAASRAPVSAAKRDESRPKATLQNRL
jgi:hypothetical protein